MPNCSVCLIVKNEAPYLLEWVAYYKTLGFDEIIIYENNSKDESERILSRLARNKIIEHRKWKLGAKESPQITAYCDAINRCKTEWILFVDCDEFLVLHRENLKELLLRFKHANDVAAIGINWRVFGSSNLKSYDDRLVIERFTMASLPEFDSNKHLKSFLRIGRIGSHIDMHLSDIEGKAVFASGTEIELETRGRANSVEFTHAQINHYFGKTPEEYEVKRSRGQGGAPENSEAKYWYTDASFEYHDRNDVEDNCALNNLKAVKILVQEYKQLL